MSKYDFNDTAKLQIINSISKFFDRFLIGEYRLIRKVAKKGEQGMPILLDKYR